MLIWKIKKTNKKTTSYFDFKTKQAQVRIKKSGVNYAIFLKKYTNLRVKILKINFIRPY